jgi:hypothetical protein
VAALEVPIGNLLKRIAEIGVGISALAISALTLWACYDTVAHPPETGTSPATLWAIAYFLAFIALALGLFGLRLLLPRLRVEGGHIIGLRAVAAFTALYGVLILAGLIAGPVTAAKLFPPLVVFFGGGMLLWERLRARSRR